jgi:hypothetical protein
MSSMTIRGPNAARSRLRRRRDVSAARVGCDGAPRWQRREIRPRDTGKGRARRTPLWYGWPSPRASDVFPLPRWPLNLNVNMPWASSLCFWRQSSRIASQSREIGAYGSECAPQRPWVTARPAWQHRAQPVSSRPDAGSSTRGKLIRRLLAHLHYDGNQLLVGLPYPLPMTTTVPYLPFR